MKEKNSFLNCGCMFALLVFNLFLGAWSVNYLLLFFLQKTIPTIGAVVIGLFAAEITVPSAIIIAVLRFFGIL